MAFSGSRRRIVEGNREAEAMHGHLWPAHPKPLPDELLTSWFVRVAEANGIKLQTLTWMLFGYGRSPWQRDVDRLAPAWFLDTICERTGLSLEEASSATLDAYRGRLYSKPRTSGMLRWILPIGSEGASRRGFGMQFCPECLARDAAPYYRKRWRLALYTYCPDHGNLLYDACPACGAPVAFFRHDFGREISETKGIACCWKCEFDFRRAKRMVIVFPTEDVREIFGCMLGALIGQTTNGEQFDMGFFAVLHQFCRIMGMGQNQGKLLAYVANRIGMPVPPIVQGRISLEERRLAERHPLLLFSLWVMVDLENRLRGAWNAKAVRYNLMVKDLHDPPEWYAALTQHFLRGCFRQSGRPWNGVEQQLGN